MIITEIEVYSFAKNEYLIREALVDTGATLCAIPKHFVETHKLPSLKRKTHIWQVRDPLLLGRCKLKFRWNKKTYNLESLVIDIPTQFRRGMKKEERCTRPRYPNPLSKWIILGENFLNPLSPSEKRILGL